MEYLNTAQELLDFIMRCKSPFHVVKEAGDLLNENGYTKLEETKEWSLVPGGKYYVTRNESSVRSRSRRAHFPATRSSQATATVRRLK